MNALTLKLRARWLGLTTDLAMALAALRAGLRLVGEGVRVWLDAEVMQANPWACAIALFLAFASMGLLAAVAAWAITGLWA